MTLPEHILKVLGTSPLLSVPTPILVTLTATGLSRPRSRVWDALVKLERKGLVVKVTTSNKPSKRGPLHPVRWALAD